MANDTMDKEALLNRIKNLFDLASNNPSEQEAEVAMNTAHRLLNKHGLDMADLHTKQETDWEVDKVETNYRSQFNSYEKYMVTVLRNLFNITPYFQSGQYHYTNTGGYWKKKLVIVGEKTDIVVAMHAFDYLCKAAKKGAHQNIGRGRWTPSHRCFAEAFAARLCSRSRKMSDASRAEARAAPTADTVSPSKYELMVVGKQNAIDKWFDSNGVKLAKPKGGGQRGAFDWGAHQAGQRAADKVNLNFKGVIGGSQSKRIK